MTATGQDPDRSTDKIEEDDWLDAMQSQQQIKAPAGTALMRVETETGLFMRDQSGRIIQRYQTPPQLAEWLHYGMLRLFQGRSRPLRLESFKHMMLYAVRQCLRKLAQHRRHISVVEAGCTIGENYFAMREMVAEDQLDLDISYFGFDINENVAAAGAALFGSSPAFNVTVGECELLGDLPDRSADLVIALGVLNHAVDAEKALADAMRVARVAVVAMIQLDDGIECRRIQAAGGTGAQWVYTIFPRRLVRQLAAAHGIRHMYTLFRTDFAGSTASRQGRYYMGIDDKDVGIEIDWVVMAKADIFPEWRTIEWIE